jgi:TatD DNase family protein
MIDTHAHLYDVHFQEDMPFHIKEIQEVGVTEVWLPNCDLESWTDLKKLSTAYPDFVLPMIGLHPTYVKENYLKELAALKAEIEQTKVLAIGEIGLDYYWDTTFAAEQMDALKQQCQWALEKGLWVDIHCRKAYADLIKTFKLPEFKELRGIIHCFSGDAREAKVLTDLGFLLGIGGVITYKNTTLFQDIKDIPLSHIVLETDAPYLSPVPFRGKPNSPKNIPLIAQKLADLFEISLTELVQQTNQNANRLKATSGY